MKLIKKLGRRTNKTGPNKQSYGLFLCPYCSKEVERPLRDGKICKSCGCAHDKLVGKANIKHGDSKSRLHYIWNNMKQRCYNKNDNAYKHYGGRGIKVCNEWKNDYVKFRDWALENGYKDNLEIDRIDNDGNYEPDNCKWSTRKEQNRNTRQNKIITYKGETHCLTEWAEILGVDAGRLSYRLGYGWSVERAFTEEVHIECRNKKTNRMITYNGETYCVAEWAEILGVKRNTLYARLNTLKWDIEKVLTTKVRQRVRRGE